jgi:hypothetical protein
MSAMSMKTLACALALLVTAPALAQTSPAPTAPPAPATRGEKLRARLDPAERERLRGEVERKLQTYITVEASSRLGLDEKKTLKLSEAVKAHLQQKREAHKTTKRELEKLRQLVDQNAGEAALQAQTKAVVDAHDGVDDSTKLFDETRRFLSAKEQAKLVIALPQMRREMRRMMMEAMHERRGNHGPGHAGAADDDDDEP